MTNSKNNAMDTHREKDKAFHAETAHFYDYITVEPRSFANDVLFSHFKRFIKSAELMIDIGCGTGHMLNRYSGLFERQIGVDHSPEMIRQAMRNTDLHSGKQGSVRFVCADAFQFLDEYSERPPQLLTAVGFLHHLRPQELNEMFDAIYKVLPRGGQTLIAEPIVSSAPPTIVDAFNGRSVVDQRLQEVGYRDVEEPDEQPLQEQALLESIQTAGLKIVRSVKSFDLLHHNDPAGSIEKTMIYVLSRYFTWRNTGNVVAVLASKP